VAKWLTLLAAIGAAIAAAVFFWRKESRETWDDTWSSVQDTAKSWGGAAADEAGKAADKATSAADGATTSASDAADEFKDIVSSAQSSASQQLPDS
jgi:hypothetical protein